MSNGQAYVIILAGGSGTRLAPLSTPEKPKQFLDLTGSGKTLLQETAERALNLTSSRNIITIGNKRHEALIHAQLADVSMHLAENVILEDKAMNTAFAIRAALEEIKSGIVVVMPSDHYIEGNYERDFIKAVKLACEDKIVTLGIKPERPDVNYGYVLNDIFVEKPDAELAEKLIERGAFWNSGIFVFDAELMKGEYKKYYPQVKGAIPFDKAIMERTEKMQVVPASFKWSDLGSFESLKNFPIYDKLVQETLKAAKKAKKEKDLEVA